MYKPIYNITNDLLKYISQVEAAKQIIENAPLIPAWERRFREEAEQRTIYFSTKIEGNKLDFDEAKRVLGGKKVQTFRRRDIKEIINYREVIEYMGRMRDTSINRENILKIHKKVMSGILPEDELGRFRTCKEALIDSSTHEVVFEPVEPEYIVGEIDALLEWLEKEGSKVHPVIKSGIILYEIARIHPFTDGNGRTSRILATYSLYSDGYDIKKFFSLEEYYDQNLEGYYKALASVEENDDDLTIWLEFFAKGLAVELDRIKKKVLDISRDVKLRKTIGQVALNDRQVRIINFMNKKGHVRNKDWQELFPLVSDDSILRDLRDLIDKGVVKKEGRTKAARYVLK
ncbi:Fic family protein [Candidatus Dojkabacteria bacterium]|nr:Fic family protein [Candidatus Dojkabacteria bacterium]